MSFKLTQTSLKDLEKEATCPFRWKKQWIDNEIQFPSSDDMDRGKYFEQQVLGSSAKQEDQTTDLPRLSSGKKSIDQVRIDAQAIRCKRILEDESDPEFLGFYNIVSQVYLESKDGKRCGTIDFVADDKEGNRWVLDLKLTKDASSSYSQYGWGNNWEDLDLIQQLHYHDLYKENTGIVPRLGLLVVDYSPQYRVIFGELVPSDHKMKLKEIRFQAGIEAISLYEKHGWIKIPSIKECERCSLQCDKRISMSQVEHKVVQY